MTDEEAKRAAIVAEARSWIGTPYISNGMIKGKRGGTDCAMFVLATYMETGFIPKDYDPRPYPPQWHIHKSEERYLSHVTTFAKEVAGPSEREPKPGDFVMFKIGMAFAHGAIIEQWPIVIHAVGGARVMSEDVSKNTIGKRALWIVPQRFFSFWD